MNNNVNSYSKYDKKVAFLIWILPSLLVLLDMILNFITGGHIIFTFPGAAFIIPLITLMVTSDPFLRKHAASRLSVEVISFLILITISVIYTSIMILILAGRMDIPQYGSLLIPSKFSIIPMALTIVNLVCYFLAKIYLFVAIIIGIIQSLKGKAPSIWFAKKFSNFLERKIRFF